MELTLETIAAEQRKDPALKSLIEALLSTGQRPSWTDIQSESEETKMLRAQFDSLKIQNEMLQRQFYSADGTVTTMQMIIPNRRRNTFLHNLRKTEGNVGMAHLGIQKTCEHVAKRVYCVGWKDVEKYCRSCAVCKSVQHGIAPKRGQLHAYEANGMGHRLHVDLTVPHTPSRRGSLYILTAIDAYSRYIICSPLKKSMHFLLIRHW